MLKSSDESPYYTFKVLFLEIVVYKAKKSIKVVLAKLQTFSINSCLNIFRFDVKAIITQ